MRLSALTLGTILFVFSSTGAIAGPAGAAASGGLHGVIADDSGGVLPGVSVAATSAAGRVLGTSITDAVGRYAFRALPEASVRLTFQLQGFSTATIELALAPDVETAVPTLRLQLAPKSETVVVRGETRAIAPAPPPPLPAVPPPPRPVLRSVPAHDRDSICGPAKRRVTPESLGTIRSGRSAKGRALYAEGDELAIDGGTSTGLEIGQNLVARRSYRTSQDPAGAAGEHTAGLLQIVTAAEHAAVALVVYACDEMRPGDWLAPFNPEPIRSPEPAGPPAYDRAARILLTDEGQLIGAPRRLMVIDQGTENGVRVGQRLTLFRPVRPGARGPAVIGDAVVVAIRNDSATIRVQHANDIIAMGDSAAPQR